MAAISSMVALATSAAPTRITPTEIGLEVALRNIETAVASLKKENRVYLTANFDIAKSSEEVVSDPQILIDKIRKSSGFLQTPENAKMAQRAIISIGVLYSDAETRRPPTVVQQALKEIQQASHDQIEFADLAGALDLFNCITAYIQNRFEHLRVMDISKKHPQDILWSTEFDSVMCGVPTNVIASHLSDSVEGMALLGQLATHENPSTGVIDLSFAETTANQYYADLTYIIQKRGLSGDHPLCRYQRFLRITCEETRFTEDLKRFIVHKSLINKKSQENVGSILSPLQIGWILLVKIYNQIYPTTILFEYDNHPYDAGKIHATIMQLLEECQKFLQFGAYLATRAQHLHEDLRRKGFANPRPTSEEMTQFQFTIPTIDTTSPLSTVSAPSATATVSIAAPAPKPNKKKAAKKKKQKEKILLASQTVATATTTAGIAQPKVERKESKVPVAVSSPAVAPSVSSPEEVSSSPTIAPVTTRRFRKVPTLVFNPKSPFYKINYAERVTLWHTDVDAALARLIYPASTPREEEIQIRNHAFTTDVDLFLCSQYGEEYVHESTIINEKTKQPNRLFSIAAYIKESDRQIRTIITYCFDENGVCYHRGMGPRSRDEFYTMALSKKIHLTNDFPTLKNSAEEYERTKTSSKPKSIYIDPKSTHATIEIGPLGIVTISDGENRVLQLLKVRKNTPA